MPQALDILKQYWGYESFRPLQEDIIQSVLDGQDTLALLPTGGGKSICFQVPAMVQEGVCIVVSPLIALMKDQVQQLQKRGIRAAAIYSGMKYSDIDRIVDNAVYGHLKFLYLSPERLQTEIIQERIKRMPLNLIAVDEAHCISQWGYDFRPPYLKIANIRELCAKPTPILALTATATPEVVLDIQDKLAFGKTGCVLQKSFARQNLAYVVRPAEGKIAQLINILKKVNGSAVVYVRNRRKCKEIAYELRRQKISATYYHAGLDMEERSKRQEAWISGQTRVVVATNAFGMGIDKADVRTVVHLDLPDSLEAYFQEAGRAGRDGKKAYAVLLYHSKDKERLKRNYELAFPTLEDIRRVYRALGSYFQLATGSGLGQSYDFDIVEFSSTYQFEVYEVYNVLKVLEQASWILVTEAVYVAAELSIRVNKDTLYDYQLKHPAMDHILKFILRSYQGAFANAVKIRENSLAKFLKISTAQLRQSLLKMHKEGIVYYTPAKNKPQIIFLQERVRTEQLSIDLKAYKTRQKKHLERMQAAIKYAESSRCRSQLLLSYFGETDSTYCEVCDTCLERKKKTVTTQEYEQYEYKIKELLDKEKALKLEDLVGAFNVKNKEALITTLSYLLDEGFVVQEDGLLTWAD